MDSNPIVVFAFLATAKQIIYKTLMSKLGSSIVLSSFSAQIMVAAFEAQTDHFCSIYNTTS